MPSAAPQVLVGFRQSLAIAWLTLIVAEQINADKGIGFLINNARDFLRIDIIIFGLIVYALLGIGTDAVVRALERRALRYRVMTIASPETPVDRPTGRGELRHVDKWYGGNITSSTTCPCGSARGEVVALIGRSGSRQVDGAAGAGRAVDRPHR